MGVLVALITLVVLALPVTSQGKRVALVIGSAYQRTPKLSNPKKDAADLSVALKGRGFQIIEGFDLDTAAFDQKPRSSTTRVTRRRGPGPSGFFRRM